MGCLTMRVTGALVGLVATAQAQRKYVAPPEGTYERVIYDSNMAGGDQEGSLVSVPPTFGSDVPYFVQEDQSYMLDSLGRRAFGVEQTQFKGCWSKSNTGNDRADCEDSTEAVGLAPFCETDPPTDYSCSGSLNAHWYDDLPLYCTKPTGGECTGWDLPRLAFKGSTLYTVGGDFPFINTGIRTAYEDIDVGGCDMIIVGITAGATPHAFDESCNEAPLRITGQGGNTIPVCPELTNQCINPDGTLKLFIPDGLGHDVLCPGRSVAPICLDYINGPYSPLFAGDSGERIAADGLTCDNNEGTTIFEGIRVAATVGGSIGSLKLDQKMIMNFIGVDFSEDGTPNRAGVSLYLDYDQDGIGCGCTSPLDCNLEFLFKVR